MGDNMCVGGCGSSKTANHLLFSCDTFGGVWFAVLQWLHLSFVAPVLGVGITFFSSAKWLGYRVPLTILSYNLVGLCLDYLEENEQPSVSSDGCSSSKFSREA